MIFYSNEVNNPDWRVPESSFWPLFLSQLTFLPRERRTKMMGRRGIGASGVREKSGSVIAAAAL